MWRGQVKRCSDTLRLGAQLVRYNLYGPGTQLSPGGGGGVLRGEFLWSTVMGCNFSFILVPSWVNFSNRYMYGWSKIVHRGTWMGLTSYTVVHGWVTFPSKLVHGCDGWWHFKIPRGTPLLRPKLSTPPPGLTYDQLH